jgi:hypothetical protein
LTLNIHHLDLGSTIFKGFGQFCLGFSKTRVHDNESQNLKALGWVSRIVQHYNRMNEG